VTLVQQLTHKFETDASTGPHDEPSRRRHSEQQTGGRGHFQYTTLILARWLDAEKGNCGIVTWVQSGVSAKDDGCWTKPLFLDWTFSSSAIAEVTGKSKREMQKHTEGTCISQEFKG